MITTPISKVISAMATIQSSPSAIELADKAQKNLFVGSIIFGVVAALIAALLAWLVWRSNNKYQDAVKADADARIATADSRAAQANAEAAKANEGLGKSNEEIARLTKEAEQAKTERAEADKQIAIAKADAARAKEGIANAEAISAKASVEVARLQVVVANAEQRRAEAEKSLLELKERIQPRTLTAKQREDFVNVLKTFPPSTIDLGYTSSGCDDCFDFLQQFLPLFKKARWEVRNEISVVNHLEIQVVGLAILVRGAGATDLSKPPPPGTVELTPALGALRLALKTIGIDVQFINMGPFRDPHVPELVVGLKPRP
jgi:seryl-tRNA synthetase